MYNLNVIQADAARRVTEMGRDFTAASYTVARRVTELQSRSLEFTLANIEAILDHFQHLWQVRQPWELFQLNQTFARQQFETATRQIQNLTGIAMGVMQEAVPMELDDAGRQGEMPTVLQREANAAQPNQGAASSHRKARLANPKTARQVPGAGKQTKAGRQRNAAEPKQAAVTRHRNAKMAMPKAARQTNSKAGKQTNAGRQATSAPRKGSTVRKPTKSAKR